MSLETVIGLEVHAELKTKTKIFCSCSTEFGTEPNHNTCPICLGLPGTLPVLNKEVVALAIKAGKAFHCDINKVNKMDRKNYFYPDLPKAYQVSQFDLPLCSNGYVEIEVDGKVKKIRLNHIHIEEDAGKLIHDDTENASYIDYNRVGVPLIEMVSEPDLRSPDEAVAYFKAIKSILEYSDISDCRMDQGSLRCDANISIREAGSDKLNTKVEMKNIGSFKELEKALKKEEKRQRELYNYGEEYKIKQETRRWDSGKGRTVSMRTKEDAHDYRYFPEPDLVPIIIEDKQIKDIEASLPEMPKEKKLRFMKTYNLPENEVSILLDTKNLAILFEETIKCGASPKATSNWILGDLLRVAKENSFDISKENLKFTPKDLADLIEIIGNGKISKTSAKEVFEDMFTKGNSPVDIIEEKGLSQISDTSALEKIVSEILDQNPKSIEDFSSGKPKAAGFLMGQIMKASKGQANPNIAKDLLIKELNNRIK